VREIKVGDTTQRSMLVTDEQIDLFARLSGDRNPFRCEVRGRAPEARGRANSCGFTTARSEEAGLPGFC
jgi:hypothetical protein